MFNIVLGGSGLFRSSWPIRLHHFVGHPSVQCCIRFTGPLARIDKHFFINDNPVHFSTWTCHKSIERRMHEENEFAHSIFILLLQYTKVMYRASGQGCLRENVTSWPD